MEVVFLIGNGPSRKNFDLYKLKDKGLIAGCNALYRDFVPDILFAIDNKMVNEILEAKLGIPCITKYGAPAGPGIIRYKTKFFNNSGAFGLRFIGEKLKPKKCYILGIDNAPGNVYFGTKNYRDKIKYKWDREIKFATIAIKEFTDTEFINVNENNSIHLDPAKFNYRYITYRDFENEIQTLQRSSFGILPWEGTMEASYL